VQGEAGTGKNTHEFWKFLLSKELGEGALGEEYEGEKKPLGAERLKGRHTLMCCYAAATKD